jgi:hypothetical protein
MVLVAHTPVPLPHPGFRAQIWLEFSMVYTVYTLSMGTYWVQDPPPKSLQARPAR